MQRICNRNRNFKICQLPLQIDLIEQIYFINMFISVVKIQEFVLLRFKYLIFFNICHLKSTYIQMNMETGIKMENVDF